MAQPLRLPPDSPTAVVPRVFRARGHSLDLSRPRVMGILNVTPDSFSDGGAFLDPRRALDRAFEIEAEGASILDVGGESSRPGSKPVPAEEELRRVLPVLKLLAGRIRIPVSIDTCKAEVMERALGEGASIVNDILAMRSDARIPRLIADSGAGVVLMHMRGTPETMQRNTAYGDVVGEVSAFLGEAAARAAEAGIARDRILADPGIGFGKSAEDNRELIRNLRRIGAAVGFPLVLGASRKSFLAGTLGGEPDLSAANAAVHAAAVLNGASVLRAHDVKAAAQVIHLTLALRSP